jgi:hypothetical protein
MIVQFLATVWKTIRDLFTLGGDLIALGRESPSVPAATPPNPGPPLTQADWSNGPPQPQPVDNPSGAIGGPGSS